MEQIPPNVRSRVAFAVKSLNRIASALHYARIADEQFGGNGRYESETWRSIHDRDAIITQSLEMLSNFRTIARGKGIDPEVLIDELGGIQNYIQSDRAALWNGEIPAGFTQAESDSVERDRR